MDNTNGRRNNKFFLRYEKHCTNVGRFANATLRHYSESSKHSPNSLQGRLSCSVRDTGHWQTGSRELQFGISD